MYPNKRTPPIAACLALLCGTPALAATVAAELVVIEGDTPAPLVNPVDSLNPANATASGGANVNGAELTSGDRFVFVNGSLVHQHSAALPFVLTGSEGSSGGADGGLFVISPSIDGNDGIWTHNGFVVADGSQAPGEPPGVSVTFGSRPAMVASGASYWVGGINRTGGTSTEVRVLYGASNSDTATTIPLVTTDDLINGLPFVNSSGIDFDFWVSDDDTHRINVFNLENGSGTSNDDTYVWVDGSLLFQETLPTGSLQGDNWDNFDSVTINNAGFYLFSGDTDGATTEDEFIADPTGIVMREGDTVAGVTLTSSASVQWLTVNNANVAAYAWDTADGEYVFASCDAGDLAATAQLVVAEGDEIDIDGDTIGDWTVVDVNNSSVTGTARPLSDTGALYLELDVTDGISTLEAIVGFQVNCCPDADADGVCDVDDVCLGNDASGDGDGDGICNDLDATCDITDLDIGSALGAVVATGSTCGAGSDLDPIDPATNCGFGSSGLSEETVYVWTAPFTGQFGITTIAQRQYDTTLQVRSLTGGACEQLACNDDIVGDLRSGVVVDLVAGEQIAIAVDGFSSSCGNYVLSIAPTSNGGLLTLIDPVPGGIARWAIAAAVPGADYRLLYSAVGAGGNPCPYPNICTTLTNPRGVVTGTVPPEGTFTVQVNVPANLPSGLTFDFQALYYDAASGLGGRTNRTSSLIP